MLLQRLRQLRWFSSTSVDFTREVEPSAHMLQIIGQDRRVYLHTYSYFPKARRAAAACHGDLSAPRRGRRQAVSTTGAACGNAVAERGYFGVPVRAKRANGLFAL